MKTTILILTCILSTMTFADVPEGYQDIGGVSMQSFGHKNRNSAKAQCRSEFNSMQEQLDSAIRENILREEPLFENGNFEYNCVEVRIHANVDFTSVRTTRAERINRRLGGAVINPRRFHQFALSMRLHCKPRSYNQRLLLSQIRNCEADPSLEYCYQANFLERTEDLEETEIVYVNNDEVCD